MALRDLSHRIESGMPVFPGGDPVRVEPDYVYEDGGVRTTAISMDSHNGTHIDAPSHMARDGRHLADVDVEAFRFDALLVDCTDLGDREPIPAARVPSTVSEEPNPASRVPNPTSEEPNPASEEPDSDPSVDLLVFRTDWSEHWGTDRYFDHPYLSEAAAATAAEHGYDVALDVMSPDPSPSENATDDEPAGHPAHDALFAEGRRIIENLRNLAGLPVRFTMHAYPLPLGRDGAQVRAVAEY